MRRINTSGCGWAISGGTYTCQGLPKLDIVFGTTSIVGSTVDGTVYDQFDRLPQHIEGFRMTLSPILDMGGTAISPEVPELACRVNFDPFDDSTGSVLNTGSDLTVNDLLKNTGFIDMYNNGPGYKDKFYVSVSGTTYHMVNDSDYPTYTDSAVMEPGALEPMLDTQFGPVQIDMPPTPDLTTDAIIYSLAGLQSWRHTIDTRVSNTYVNASETGMANLQNAINQQGPCSQFNIEANPPSGSLYTTVIGAPGFREYPTYTITGGTVKVDGVTLPNRVEDFTPAGAIFDAYLDVFRYNNILGATITTTDSSPTNLPQSIKPATGTFDHLKFEYIGSVRSVTTADGPISGSTAWQLYEIEQGDCIYEITIGGGTGGGSTCTQEYYGAFMVDVAPGTSVGTAAVEITGVDGAWENDSYVPKAGYICYNGVSCGLVGTASIASVSPGSNIWLEAHGPGVAPTYTTEDAPTEDTPPAYRVRLARIPTFITKYTTKLEGTPTFDNEYKDEVMTVPAMFAPGSAVTPNEEDGGHTGTLTPGETGTIYEVIDNTCTGYYQIGLPATYTAVDEPEVVQIHHGDVYVDGRWL